MYINFRTGLLDTVKTVFNSPCGYFVMRVWSHFSRVLSFLKYNLLIKKHSIFHKSYPSNWRVI